MQQKNPLANIRFEQTSGIICEKCKGSVFSEGYVLRKVSKFLVATVSDKNQVIPVPTFYCVKCNHVNREFLPEGLHNEENSDE